MTASPLGQFRGYPTERRFPEPIRESPKAWLQRCGHDFTTSIQSRFGKQNQRCPDAPSDWIQSLPPPVHSREESAAIIQGIPTLTCALLVIKEVS